MPELDRFDGIIVRMYYEVDAKHHRPHFHVEYNEYEASYDFNGNLIKGKLPLNKAKRVKKWIKDNKDTLTQTWAMFEGKDKGGASDEN